MCNCIQKIESKLNDKFHDDTKCQDYKGVELDNKTLMIESGNVELSGFCEVKYQVGKQNKKWRGYAKFNYCPFCGEKYPSLTKSPKI
jgi:hypothetical protein